jgi:hypothetical protein
MTPEKMTIICNIQMMREKITGIETNYNNAENSDLHHMSEDQLYNLQYSLISEYNNALNN